MIGYLFRRFVQAIIVVILVAIVTFILLQLLPGGAARAIIGPRATPQQIASFNHAQGYDRPLPVQFGIWVNQLVHGNLGFSYKLNQSVASLIADRLPKTVLLVALSIVVALVLSIPLGVYQARKRNTVGDYFFTAWSFILYATPTFFLGLVLIIVFAIYFPVLPPTAPNSDSIVAILQDSKALILPVMTLALVSIASFSRYARSSVLDNLTQDYVRTAKAKGAGDLRIMVRHVLRNALIPIVTILGLSLPALFAGALITETVFNYPGMGYLFFTEAQTRDYPVLLGITLITAVATVIGSLLADITYAIMDPRVKLTG